jgi:hypothetical protein
MSTELPEAIPAPPVRVSRVGAALSLIGTVAAIVGGVMLWRAGEGTVETIRVSKHSMLPDSLVGSPDLYSTALMSVSESARGRIISSNSLARATHNGPVASPP